jgi:hypothetical protein
MTAMVKTRIRVLLATSVALAMLVARARPGPPRSRISHRPLARSIPR